jgi:hypothetical protein
MSFTYQHIRDEVKQRVLANPIVCIPGHSFEWLLQHVRQLPPGAVLLELGTFVGGSAQGFAKANPNITIHTVDLNNFGPEHPAVKDLLYMLLHIKERYNLPDLTLEDLNELQKMHIEDYPNIISHTGHSRSLDIDNVDAVFIDADHDGGEVFADLEYAWARLKDNGYILGDDVNASGIHNAFSKFCLMNYMELRIFSKCAMIQKKEVCPGMSYLGKNDLEFFHPFVESEYEFL